MKKRNIKQNISKLPTLRTKTTPSTNCRGKPIPTNLNGVSSPETRNKKKKKKKKKIFLPLSIRRGNGSNHSTVIMSSGKLIKTDGLINF